jgi:acetyl-CoA carboxylase carboxyl transferase subunit beta
MQSVRLNSQQLIDLVLDAGSFQSWDVTERDPAEISPEYLAELTAAREKTGLTESVITGKGTIRGIAVAVVVGEFAFLAGSIGVAAASRIMKAFERATQEKLPLIAAPVSGGTRMQEGTVAFLQMVGITGSVTAHRKAGLPYLVYLRHPTTGGVFASWGSLGHVTVAEPGALIGFLGPRVYEALHGEPFPEGVQTSENLFAHGLIDAVLPPEKLADMAARALNVLTAPREGLVVVEEVPIETLQNETAWTSILRSRQSDRPGVRSILRYGANSVVPLHGTSEGETGPGMMLALAKFGEAPAVVLAQDRAHRNVALGPGALREARRGMHLADELGLPLVTIIDTGGAALSRESEERGLAGEIARSLADQLELRAPVICLLLGQGSGGGALAILPADRVLAAENAWLSPLPPEGASVIVHRNKDRADEMAEAQGVKARDLMANGIVDRIIAERPEASAEPQEFSQRVSQVLEREIIVLLNMDPRERLLKRHHRYRHLGHS